MKHHEKKYRVSDFEGIQAKLKELGAQKVKNTSSTHYYAQQASNDVIKLVHYTDRDEIHVLKETDGTFSLAETITVKDIDNGFEWLKRKGYTTVDVVKMDYVDYGYDDGVVGLYTINNNLHSVILDFPKNKHTKIEEVFGLDEKEVIAIPYNKYLQQKGLSNTKNI